MLREDEIENSNDENPIIIPPGDRVGKFEAIIIFIASLLLIISPFVYFVRLASYGGYVLSYAYNVGNGDPIYMYVLPAVFGGIATLIVIYNIYFENQNSKIALIFPIIGIIAIILPIEYMISLSSHSLWPTHNLIFQ